MAATLNPLIKEAETYASTLAAGLAQRGGNGGRDRGENGAAPARELAEAEQLRYGISRSPATVRRWTARE